MLVCKAAGFIYRDECLEFAKPLLESVDCIDAFDLQVDNQIGEAFFGGRWLCFAFWDEWTKMRKALINQLD